MDLSNPCGVYLGGIYRGEAPPDLVSFVLQPVQPNHLRPALTEDERKLRLLDIARGAAMARYDAAKLTFALAQYADLPPLGRPALERAAKERVDSAVAYVAEFVRQRLAADILGLPDQESTHLIIDLSANLAFDHLSQRHPDTVVKLVAGWGYWALHCGGGSVAVTYQGLGANAPELEM